MIKETTIQYLLPENNSIAGILIAILILLCSVPVLVCRKKSLLLFIFITSAGITSLVLLQSRAGLLGLIAGCLYATSRSVLKLPGKSVYFVTAAFLLISITFIFLWKTDSSRGRMHIYSLSFDMFKKNWADGIGYGKFKTEFNKEQADFFSTHSLNDTRALLADNTYYAFNDYLQWIVETGVAGLIGMILTLYFLFRRCRQLHARYGISPLLLTVQSCLLCIAVSSLFSYPMHCILVQFFTLLFVGVLLFYPLKTENRVFKMPALLFYRILVLSVLLYYLYSTANHLAIKRKEQLAFELTKKGCKHKATDLYRELIAADHLHGYNHYFLAKRLYYSGNLTEAHRAIITCQKYYSGNDVFLLEAQIEVELEKYDDAETSLKKAVYMVPDRMTSRYKLMKFYIMRKDTAAARHWANSILSMRVKIKSSRTDVVLAATKDSIVKWGL